MNIFKISINLFVNYNLIILTYLTVCKKIVKTNHPGFVHFFSPGVVITEFQTRAGMKEEPYKQVIQKFGASFSTRCHLKKKYFFFTYLLGFALNAHRKTVKMMYLANKLKIDF